MHTFRIKTLVVVLILPAVCAGDNLDFNTVEGGALYLKRGLPGIVGSEVETHRAEFDVAADCEHVAKIMNQAEPNVSWYCSTSMPDIEMTCEISGFELDSKAESETGFQAPKSLEFNLVLNRGVARGSSDLGVLLGFNYTESNSGYLLTSDYPYAAENYFTRAVYLLIIDARTGAVQIRDIGGGANGDGQCKTVEVESRNE